MVSIARTAGGLMAGLDLKSVVIGGEMRVSSHAPFHVDGKSRRAGLTAVGATEIHRVSAPGNPPLGTGTATPVRKTSSSPEIGTVVIQVFVTESNVVEEQVALGENVILAFGTAIE